MKVGLKTWQAFKDHFAQSYRRYQICNKATSAAHGYVLELSPMVILGLSPSPEYNPDVCTVKLTPYRRQTFQQTAEYLAKLHEPDNLT